MTYHVHSSSPLSDISLRFCSCCLKKFCPRPETIEGNSVRFFVPTIDVLFREHFAYVQVPRRLVDFLYENEETCSVNLSEVAHILHVEKGAYPSAERVDEIISFYDWASVGLVEIAGNRLTA